MLASLAFGMIAARYLSKHDYATLRQTFLAYEFASPLLMLGLPNAIYFLMPRETQTKRGVIIDNMALLAGAGLLFSLFIASGGYRLLAMRFDNSDLNHTLPWLIPYPLLVMPVAGFAAIMVCANKARALALYNVLSSLVLAISGIMAILWTRSYMYPVLVRIAVSAMFLPIILSMTYKAVPGRIRWPRRKKMLEMLGYSVPLGLASMLGSITLQLHSIIVASLCTTEDFAVYINGAIEIPLIGIVTGSIATVVFAEMSELCSRGEKQSALELFHKASIKAACILFPAMCFLMILAEPFIVLLFSEQYRGSVIPFMIYLLVLPMRIVVYGSALMALGMSRLILFRSLLDLAINSVLCFLLVKILGYIGAAIGTVLTLYLWTVPFNMAKISAGFDIPWQMSLPFGSLFRVLVLCLVFTPLPLAGAYTNNYHPLVKLTFSAVLYFPAVGYFLYRFKYLSLPSRFEVLLPKICRV